MLQIFNHVIYIVLALCLWVSTLSAQTEKKYTISGYVSDKNSGEVAIGASVYIKETMKGTATNTYGFYSITVTEGRFHLVCKFIGYKDFEQEIDLHQSREINIMLESAAVEMEAVEVKAEKTDKNIKSTQLGTVQLEMNEIKKLPAFMGEVDVLKTIQLIPGVKSAGDGNSGFYVRGGGPDQNLILLDEATVYNASHLLGFFSVFNGDAVKNVSLIKGNMPAQYGQRLSSVLDISMKEGNNKKLAVNGGIGLISSRLTIEGPIKKDTGSFIISARRTYIDLLLKPFLRPKSDFYGSSYYFYDLNTKLNYRLSQKDRLFLSGYFGRDVFSYNNNAAGFHINSPWGNATTSLRWNHLFSDKLFVNTSAIFSNYNFQFGASQSGFEFRLYSGIRDWNAKVDFNYFPNVRHNIRFGGNYVFHTFIPSNATAKSGDVVFETGEAIKLYAHDAAVYVGDDIELTDHIRLNAGLRFSYFMQVGPFRRQLQDYQGKTTDSLYYGPGKKVAAYSGLEPRISARFATGKHSSIKAGFTQNYQYVHLASLSSVSLPTDVWMPSTDVIKPQLSYQYSAGYFHNFLNDHFETSVEAYYKDMYNLVEYKEGAMPDDNVKSNPDNSFTFGRGFAYGAEFFVKKREGQWTGWVGYTLSWTSRIFKEINQGKAFYAKYDRRHDISLVMTYELNKKWIFSSIFVYATGNAATLPVARYVIEGRVVNEYGARNSYRMSPYHRLDISATYTPDRSRQREKRKKRLEEKYQRKGLEKEVKVPHPVFKHYESSWTFSIFNVYNRYNPYFIYFETKGNVFNGELQVKARQISLFPIIPSVTWNFKF